jgi:hypothetical protein
MLFGEYFSLRHKGLREYSLILSFFENKTYKETEQATRQGGALGRLMEGITLPNGRRVGSIESELRIEN